jgi:hypothetical protein
MPSVIRNIARPALSMASWHMAAGKLPSIDPHSSFSRMMINQRSRLLRPSSCLLLRAKELCETAVELK